MLYTYKNVHGSLLLTWLPFSRLRQYMLRNDFQGHVIPIYSYAHIIEIAIHCSLAVTPFKFVIEKLHENN